MSEKVTFILKYKINSRKNYFEIYWETLECLMIKGVQTDRKQTKFCFQYIFKWYEGRTLISFSKNQSWIRRGWKEKVSRIKEWVQGTNTSKDCNLLMTLICFICVVHTICSILHETNVKFIFEEHQIHSHF